MTTPEAQRHDLYTRLVEVLGEPRAETLMAHLPNQSANDLATKADLTGLRGDLINLRTAMDTRFDRLEARFDRLFLTVVAGLFVVVASVIATTLG
jgi:hypothetical protein